VPRRGSSGLLFGHPDCTRVELFVPYEQGGSPRLIPILREGHEEDLEMMRAFFERNLGGLNFRDDTTLERICRAAGVLLIDPRWVLGSLRRWTLQRLEDVGTSATRLAWDIARRRIRIDSFSVVSHHFMNAAELATEKGRERLNACVFRVPVGDEMVSMCRVNAGGVRDAVYAGRLLPAGPTESDIGRAGSGRLPISVSVTSHLCSDPHASDGGWRRGGDPWPARWSREPQG
jgi:hypothetical protein